MPFSIPRDSAIPDRAAIRYRWLDAAAPWPTPGGRHSLSEGLLTIQEFTGPPARLKLSRTTGFDLQAASLALNGRRAVNCARPGPFGNPFHHNDDGTPMLPERAGVLFRAQMLGDGWFVNDHGKTIRTADIVKRLAGHNLACFCPVDAPWCHCVPLLLVANAGGACL